MLPQSALATDWRQVARLYQDSMAPGELLAVLEGLIAEKRLSPSVARRIEEAVRRQTDRGAWKGTVQAFQLKTWMLQLALKHEDCLLERQCLRDLARLQAEPPAAEAAYQRCRTQWHRHWEALLK